MHSKIINIYTILLFLLCGTIIGQTTDTDPFKDYQFETYNSANIKALNIITQHATVNILNWEKDSISIETTAEVLSDKENLSAELLENINTSIRKSSSSIKVQTTLSGDFNYTTPYSIVYNIFCPKQILIRIKNEYGTVNAADFKNGFNADLNYCDIKIQDVSDSTNTKNNINLTFCKGAFKDVGSAVLNIKNSEISFSNASDIQCNSAYSKTTFNHLISYVGTSNIDKIYIDKVDSIHLTATNTLSRINTFTQTAFFEFEKGKLDIISTSPEFKKLTINGNQTAVSIAINKNASYLINGEIKFGKLIHPKLNSIQVIEDGFASSFNGEINNPGQNKPLSQVIVFNQKQNVEFK